MERLAEKRRHTFHRLAGPGEASCGRQRQSFPVLVPQGLSISVEVNCGSGAHWLPSLDHQVLFIPAEARIQRAGPSFPSLAKQGFPSLGDAGSGRGDPTSPVWKAIWRPVVEEWV